MEVKFELRGIEVRFARKAMMEGTSLAFTLVEVVRIALSRGDKNYKD